MVPPSDRLFLDTGYVIARFNRRDQYHARALQVAPVVANCRELWTTDAVLLEVGSAFSRRGTRSLFTGLWDRFYGKDPRYRVIPITAERLHAALELFRAGDDKSWSLTDCLSFIAMREFALTDALTPDRHFEQAGFRALMRDE